jgi:uncharacterized membrane protein YjfL (UPF0719 family)
MFPLFAAATHTLQENIINTLVFGGLGAVMMFVLGWLLFDVCTRKICFIKELVQEKNIAVAIVIAAFLLGIAHIIASVVGG